MVSFVNVLVQERGVEQAVQVVEQNALGYVRDGHVSDKLHQVCSPVLCVCVCVCVCVWCARARVCLFVCLFVCFFVCLFACLFVCL